MARPATAPTDLAHCPVHGDVVARLHKVGRSRSGAQRYAWRCPECHATYQGALNHGQPAPDVPTYLGFCGADDGALLTCRRPAGHPADLCATGDGAYFTPVRKVRRDG
jgi:hypothetical protein